MIFWKLEYMKKDMGRQMLGYGEGGKFWKDCLNSGHYSVLLIHYLFEFRGI